MSTHNICFFSGEVRLSFVIIIYIPEVFKVGASWE